MTSAGAIPGASSAPAAERARLGAVDGLRAAAALWVVLFHVRAFSGARLGVVPGLDLFVRSGSTGVSLFLVLSGFCLYVPFAGGRTSRFATRDFLARRCRRLLPAYYASLALILVAVTVAPPRLGLAEYSATELAGQTAAHATLTHPFFTSTFYALNGAYWSLGLEWQLYLALPLLIVGVRRFGLGRTVAVAIGANVVYRLLLELVIRGGIVDSSGPMATAVLPNFILGRWAEFALGMVAAELYATGRVAVWARRLRYAAAALVPVGLATAGGALSHLIFGSVFFVVLCMVLSRDTIVSRIFSWPPLVALGLMSYSLYLVHQPLIQIGAAVLGGGGASPSRVFVLLVLLLPLVVAAAWLLFVTVERHTLTTRSVEDIALRRILFPTLSIGSAASRVASLLRGVRETAATPAATETKQP